MLVRGARERAAGAVRGPRRRSRLIRLRGAGGGGREQQREFQAAGRALAGACSMTLGSQELKPGRTRAYASPWLLGQEHLLTSWRLGSRLWRQRRASWGACLRLRSPGRRRGRRRSWRWRRGAAATAPARRRSWAAAPPARAPAPWQCRTRPAGRPPAGTRAEGTPGACSCRCTPAHEEASAPGI